MINIWISALIMIFSFNFYYFSYVVSGVNRAIISTPLSIFETSIPLVSTSDIPELYFDQQILVNKLDAYYADAFKRYTDDYEITYQFSNNSDLSICTTNICKAVVITFEVPLSFNYKFERQMFYEIQRN